jgi:hypothetical protein
MLARERKIQEKGGCSYGRAYQASDRGAKKLADLATEPMGGDNPVSQEIWDQIYAQALRDELQLS